MSGPVTGWASGVPTYISMYEYVPAKLAASPPVVVAAHYCGGSASAMFGFTGMPAIEAAADKYGFIMIFPQTTNPATSADCWDVGSKASLTHDGGGDTQAISEMVKYEVSKRNADATRVYMMGASSGAMLTEAMLAVYPDVFKAGAEFSGVPAGCWSDGWSAASNWGGTCATGNDMMTAQAWGTLVHGMYPGYTGYRPRIQLWHGTADMTINYNNEGEAIKEWTNVLGLNTTPNSTDTTSTPGFTIEKWQNSPCGFTVLEAHIQAGGGHTTPIDSNSVVSFFGLDKTGADPEITACGGSGSGGAGGAGAGGGSSAAGGSSTGGTTTGGAAGNNGVGGAHAGSGGEATTSGGTSNTASGGAPSGNNGGAPTGSSGGASNGSGAGNTNASGTSGTVTGGSSDEPGTPDSNAPNGCSCSTAGSGAGSRGAASLALLAFALSFVRRIRRKR